MNEEYTLTGRFYHKKTFFGLILMVEIKYKKSVNNGGYVTMETFSEYVKAKEVDLMRLRLTCN